MAKTDNHNPKAKLDLRRYFLRKYHSDGSASVLDCCQGGGVMWHTLRNEFPIQSYWGVDLKPKKGRLKIDSVRILAQPGWTQNVIDVDTYGSPWKHYFALLPVLQHSATIFLTIGNQSETRMQPGAHGGEQFEFPPSTPKVLRGKVLADNDVTWLLPRCCEHGKLCIEAVEAISDGNARYIGLRVEPIKTPAVEVETPKQAKHKQAKKEPAHV